MGRAQRPPDDPEGPTRCARLWTSSLLRTIQTAALIPHPIVRGPDGTPNAWEEMSPRVYRNIDEIFAGDCEGLTPEEMEKAQPQTATLRKTDKIGFRYPRGESCFDLISRLEPCIQEMESYAEPLLIVSHQAILRLIFAYLTGVDREKAPLMLDAIHQNVVYQIDLDASSESHITGDASARPRLVKVWALGRRSRGGSRRRGGRGRRGRGRGGGGTRWCEYIRAEGARRGDDATRNTVPRVGRIRIRTHFFLSQHVKTVHQRFFLSPGARFTAGWARAGSRVRPFKPTNSVSNPNRCAARARDFIRRPGRHAPRLVCSLCPRRGDIVRRARHRSEPPARSLAHRAPPAASAGSRAHRAGDRGRRRRGACRHRSSR